MTPTPDLTGRTFAQWTVQHRTTPGPNGQTQWSCTCECGHQYTVRGSELTRGRTNSCRPCANANRGAHIHNPEMDIDEIAVERVLIGRPPAILNHAEKLECVRLLTKRGESATTIAKLISVATKTVQRYQAHLRDREAAA